MVAGLDVTTAEGLDVTTAAGLDVTTAAGLGVTTAAGLNVTMAGRVVVGSDTVRIIGNVDFVNSVTTVVDDGMTATLDRVVMCTVTWVDDMPTVVVWVDIIVVDMPRWRRRYADDMPTVAAWVDIIVADMPTVAV